MPESAHQPPPVVVEEQADMTQQQQTPLAEEAPVSQRSQQQSQPNSSRKKETSSTSSSAQEMKAVESPAVHVPASVTAPTVRIQPAVVVSAFPRPSHFPSESWPTPPLARVASASGRAQLASELAASPCGSVDAFQRIVLGTSMVRYVGGLEGGLAHGAGRAEFAAGQVYEGAFYRGAMHGEGCYTWPDGSSYTGIMTQHSATGVGLIVWPDGSTYQGDVVDGYRHGEGTFIDPTVPCLYEGEWRRGLRHGQGKITYDEAGLGYYEGQWIDGARHGYGLLRYKSGNLYEGDWAWDRKVGAGTMHWYTLNQRYTGNWLNDRPDGQGEYTWLDLPVSGVRHPDSVRNTHGALAGTRANQLVTHFQHHNRYVGALVQGVRVGRGTFHYSNGSVYSGEWDADRKHGTGRYTFANGSTYEGEFTHDTMSDQSKWKNPYSGVAEAVANLTLTASSIPAQPPTSRTAKALEAATNAAQKDIGMFDLPLDDLLVVHAASIGVGDAGGGQAATATYIAGQRDALLNLLLRYNTELLDIYRFYAQLDVQLAAPEYREPVLPFEPQSPTTSLTREPASAQASNVSARMNLAQLWAFVSDIGIGQAGKGAVNTAPDLTLADINRVVLAGTSPANRTLLHDLVGLHDTRQILLLREFAQALIRLAEVVYEHEADVEAEAPATSEDAAAEQKDDAETEAEPEDPSILYAQALEQFNSMIMGAEMAPPVTTVVNELALPLASMLLSPPSVFKDAAASPKSAKLHSRAPSRSPSRSPSRGHSRGPSFSGSATGPSTPVHGSQHASTTRSGGGVNMQTGGTSAPFSSTAPLGSPFASTALLGQTAPLTRAQSRTLAVRFKRFLLQHVLPKARTRSKHGFGPAWTGSALFHGKSLAVDATQPIYRIAPISALVKQYERDLHANIFLPCSTVHTRLDGDSSGGALGALGLPPLVDRTARLVDMLEHLRSQTTCFNSFFTLYHALDVLFGSGNHARSALHSGLHRELLWEECVEVLVRIALYRGKVLAAVGASLAKERAAVQERDRKRQEDANAAVVLAAEEAAAAAALGTEAEESKPNSKPGSAKVSAKKGATSSTASQKKKDSVPPSPKNQLQASGSKKDLVAAVKKAPPSVVLAAAPTPSSAVDAPTQSPRGAPSARSRTHHSHVSLGGESGSFKKRGISVSGLGEDLSHLALSVEPAGPSLESLHAAWTADCEHFFCALLHQPPPDGVDPSFPIHLLMV